MIEFGKIFRLFLIYMKFHISKNQIAALFQHTSRVSAKSLFAKIALARNDKTRHYHSFPTRTKFLTHAFMQEITPARVDKKSNYRAFLRRRSAIPPKTFVRNLHPDVLAKRQNSRVIPTHKPSFRQKLFCKKLYLHAKTHHYRPVPTRTKFLTHAFMQEITPARADGKSNCRAFPTHKPSFRQKLFCKNCTCTR